jgi:hypothetical protein
MRSQDLFLVFIPLPPSLTDDFLHRTLDTIYTEVNREWEMICVTPPSIC